MAQKRLTDIPTEYDPRTFRNFSRDINARFAALEAAVQVYSVTNFTETRTLDISSATPTDMGNFLATLVFDLQNAGRLGKG